MIRLTNKEHECYDDYARCMEDKYDMEEVNDAMYRKLKALEDIEENLGMDLVLSLSGLKRCYKNEENYINIKLRR